MSRSGVRRRLWMDGDGRQRLGGRQCAGRRVRAVGMVCDCCSAVLARTHDYVCYGTVCPGCWCWSEVADGSIGVPMARHVSCEEGRDAQK
jgi:hypothetical protein